MTASLGCSVQRRAIAKKEEYKWAAVSLSRLLTIGPESGEGLNGRKVLSCNGIYVHDLYRWDGKILVLGCNRASGRKEDQIVLPVCGMRYKQVSNLDVLL